METLNTEDLQSRSFKEVFQDHLQLSERGDFENDLRRNYSPDIVLLIENKIYRGYEGIRELAIRLKKERVFVFGSGKQRFLNQLV